MATTDTSPDAPLIRAGSRVFGAMAVAALLFGGIAGAARDNEGTSSTELAAARSQGQAAQGGHDDHGEHAGAGHDDHGGQAGGGHDDHGGQAGGGHDGHEDHEDHGDGAGAGGQAAGSDHDDHGGQAGGGHGDHGDGAGGGGQAAGGGHDDHGGQAGGGHGGHEDHGDGAGGGGQAAGGGHDDHGGQAGGGHGDHGDGAGGGGHGGHGDHGDHGDGAGGGGHDGHGYHGAGCADDHPTTVSLAAQVRESLDVTYKDVVALVALGYHPYFDSLVPGGYPPGGGGISHWLNPSYIDNGVVLDPMRPEAVLLDEWNRPIGMMFINDAGVPPIPVYVNDDGTECSPWHPHTDMPARFGWYYYRAAYDGEIGGAIPEQTPEMMHVWAIPNPAGVYAAHDSPPPEAREGPPGPLPSYLSEGSVAELVRGIFAPFSS